MDQLKTNPARVSIVIPCYNYGEFLGEALNSVKNQVMKDWECIVVDNGSTDHTKDVAKKFTESDKRFQYIYQSIKGVSAARNMGIRAGFGKYIFPLDADDKIHPDYLNDAVKILDEQPSVKIVYCEAEFFGAVTGKWMLPDFSIELLLKENLIFSASLFRRADFEKTTGYSEEMISGFEDWDFWLELLKDGGDVYRIPKVLFYYRVRSESRNNSLDLENQKALRRQIYQHHKSLYDKCLKMPDILLELYWEKERVKKLESASEFMSEKFITALKRKVRSFLKI